MDSTLEAPWLNKGADVDCLDVSTTIHPVVALHCSGADGRQWRGLPIALGARFRVIAPSLIGCGDAGPWSGAHAFTLMDEARAIIALLDALDRPVHLVGHSYGGGVALKVAAERPACIASLALYEPSAFHLLRHATAGARSELAEIEELARAVGHGLVTGAYRQAAKEFIDYWSAEGAWAAMRPEVRDNLVKWLPKAPLDFRALIADDTPMERLARIACPVLLLRGARARAPSRRICDLLARHLPDARIVVVAGAGHMGPLTHTADVESMLRAHILKFAPDSNDAPHVDAAVADIGVI